VQSFHNDHLLRLTTGHDLRAFGSTVEIEMEIVHRAEKGENWGADKDTPVGKCFSLAIWSIIKNL